MPYDQSVIVLSLLLSGNRPTRLPSENHIAKPAGRRYQLPWMPHGNPVGRLAQRLAQLLYTQLVGGSNPSPPTTSPIQPYQYLVSLPSKSHWFQTRK